MKSLFPPVFALAAACAPFLPAQAQNAQLTVLSYPLPGVTLRGNIEIADFSSGKWETPALNLVQDGNNFNGSFECQSGTVQITGQFVPKDDSVEVTFGWSAPSDLPPTSIWVNLRFDEGALAGASLTSQAQSIPLDQVRAGETRGFFPNASEFSVGPVEGKTITVTPESSCKVEALFYQMWTIRFIAAGAQQTSSKEPVSANGKTTFTVSLK
jgi:hypothetical protein